MQAVHGPGRCWHSSRASAILLKMQQSALSVIHGSFVQMHLQTREGACYCSVSIPHYGLRQLHGYVYLDAGWIDGGWAKVFNVSGLGDFWHLWQAQQSKRHG